MKHYKKDIPISIFAVIAAAAFLASIPATVDLIALYHSPDEEDWVAVIGVWALLFVMEGGAVASKLSTLFVTRGKWLLNLICISILSINTVGNYVRAVGYAQAQGVADAALWIGAAVWGALPPIILYLMLHLIVARVQQLRGEASDITAQVQQDVAPLLKMQQQYLIMQQVMSDMQHPTIHVNKMPTKPKPQVSPPLQHPQLEDEAPTMPQGIYSTLRDAVQHDAALPHDDAAAPHDRSTPPAADEQQQHFSLDDLLHAAGVSRDAARTMMQQRGVTTPQQAYALLYATGRLPQGMTVDELEPLFDELMQSKLDIPALLKKRTGEIAKAAGVDRSTILRWKNRGVLEQELEKIK